MSTTDYPGLIASLSPHLAALRADIPDTTRGFGALAQGAMRDGVLDKKAKELIATALSVGARCDPCIGYHVQALQKLGVTRAEFEEMLAVCIYMGGGPALMYAAKALQAWDEFSAQKQPAPASI
jgi:AhpD family alkylhydroperoxidase